MQPIALAARSKPDRAAYDYNISRHAVLLARPGEVLTIYGHPEGLPAYVERVLATVTGMWLHMDDRCKPETGNHEPECAHAANLIPVTASQLAKLTYGKSRGTYLAQTKRAMLWLALASVQASWPDPTEEGMYIHATGHILSTLMRDGNSVLVPDLPGDAEFIIAFDPFWHRDLMAGHFQYIPVNAVEKLTGLWAFKFYRAIMCQPPTMLLKHGKREYVEYTLSGPKASIPLARLGFGERVRSGVVMARLEGMAKAINRVEGGIKVELLKGAKDGLKVRVTRNIPLRKAEHTPTVLESKTACIDLLETLL